MTTREQIAKGLPFIFSVGTPNRKFCISEGAKPKTHFRDDKSKYYLEKEFALLFEGQ
jgi:hypothetical protein